VGLIPVQAIWKWFQSHAMFMIAGAWSSYLMLQMIDNQSIVCWEVKKKSTTATTALPDEFKKPLRVTNCCIQKSEVILVLSSDSRSFSTSSPLNRKKNADLPSCEINFLANFLTKLKLMTIWGFVIYHIPVGARASQVRNHWSRGL